MENEHIEAMLVAMRQPRARTEREELPLMEEAQDKARAALGNLRGTVTVLSDAISLWTRSNCTQDAAAWATLLPLLVDLLDKAEAVARKQGMEPSPRA